MTKRRRSKRHRRPMSTATKRRISAALRGKKHPHRGVRPTAATRARESAAHKGRRHPHKGHRMSAATRAKISRALKGRHHKTHCHCGTSSKNSLKKRRAQHAQSISKLLHGDTVKLKMTKTRGKKRSKVHSKAHAKTHVTMRGSFLGHDFTMTASPRRSSVKRGKGKCHCPKRNAKHHARIRKHLARHSAHHASHSRRQSHGRGKTSVFFTP